MSHSAGNGCASANSSEAKANVVIVLPAYNEEKNLPGLLARIRTAMTAAVISYEVIVVDDGSTDQTRELAEQWAERMPVRLYRHHQNQGLGATLRDGLDLAAGRGAIVVTMDSDESHDPAIIPHMAALIDAGKQVVIASRYQPGARVEGLSSARRILSNSASLLFRAFFPIEGVRDYTCGFRAYDAKALQSAVNAYGGTLVTEQGFQCMAGILLKLRRLGFEFAEVPMVLRYDLKQSSSKIKIFKTVAGTLGMMVRHLTVASPRSGFSYER